MSGTYRGVGSIMKFYKRNAALRWHAQFDEMTRVNAIAVRESSNQGNFFGCGANNYIDRGVQPGQRTSDSEAWIFSMNGDDGKVNWMLKFSGVSLDTNRLSDSC